MTSPLDDILFARANDMALADGDVVSTLYIVAAANTLEVELHAARDRLLAAPPVNVQIAGAAQATSAEALPQPDVAPAAEPDAAAQDSPPPPATRARQRKPSAAVAAAPADLAPAATDAGEETVS